MQVPPGRVQVSKGVATQVHRGGDSLQAGQAGGKCTAWLELARAAADDVAVQLGMLQDLHKEWLMSAPGDMCSLMTCAVP